MSTSCEVALRRMRQMTFDDKSTLVHVMAWCCQATSHYLKQCWPKSFEVALRRMRQITFDDKSTLVQVMAWCRRATSHYLKQYWPKSMSWYGITRVKLDWGFPMALREKVTFAPNTDSWSKHGTITQQHNRQSNMLPPLVFHEERFQLPVSLQCGWIICDTTTYLHIFKRLQRQ